MTGPDAGAGGIEVAGLTPKQRNVKPAKVRVLVARDDGKLSWTIEQPPADKRTAAELVKWLREANPDGGEFFIVREVAHKKWAKQMLSSLVEQPVT